MNNFLSLTSLGLLWLISISLTTFAQSVPFEQKGVLDLRIHYDPNYSKTTKWPNPKKGLDVFLPPSAISMRNYTGPALIPSISIFKGFTIAGRWFGLLGDFVAAPGVIWEYQDNFSFVYQGQKYDINKQKLAKYPPLLKRLQYAMPTALDFKLRLQVSDDAGNGYGIELFTYNNDHIMNIEGRMPYVVPMSSSRWADRMNIGVYVNADEALVKKTWGTLTQVKGESFLDITKLTLPLNEFIAIANLYIQYEKEGKKLAGDYKMLDDGYTPPGNAKPYVKTDSWSKPYVPEIKTATVFKENDRVGLRSGNKIVFESPNYWPGRPLPNSEKFFSFQNKESGANELFTAKGKKMLINDIENFRYVEEEKNTGNYVLISSIDESKPVAYTTLGKYTPGFSFKELYYTENGLSTVKQEDREAYNNRMQGGSASGGVTIGFSTYKFRWHPVSVITTDKNLKVIKTETGYVYDTVR